MHLPVLIVPSSLLVVPGTEDDVCASWHAKRTYMEHGRRHGLRVLIDVSSIFLRFRLVQRQQQLQQLQQEDGHALTRDNGHYFCCCNMLQYNMVQWASLLSWAKGIDWHVSQSIVIDTSMYSFPSILFGRQSSIVLRRRLRIITDNGYEYECRWQACTLYCAWQACTYGYNVHNYKTKQPT